MNKFACYHCGKHLAFRLDQFGKTMKCPKCQFIFSYKVMIARVIHQ